MPRSDYLRVDDMVLAKLAGKGQAATNAQPSGHEFEAPDWDSVMEKLAGLPVQAKAGDHMPDEEFEAPDWNSINEMRGHGLAKAAEYVPDHVELPVMPDLLIDDLG